MNCFRIAPIVVFTVLAGAHSLLMFELGRTHQEIESNIELIASNLRKSSESLKKMQSSLREGDEALIRTEAMLRQLKNVKAKPHSKQEPPEELPFPRYMASDIPWGPHVVAMYQHSGMLPGEFWTFEQIESAWAEGDPSIIRIVPPDWQQGIVPIPELIPAPKKESTPCEN